jgi:plasmid stabilization system protein ParE
MTYQIKVLSRAAAQLEDCTRWWWKHRTAARNQVELEFSKVVEIISQTPHVGTLYKELKSFQVRRLPLKKTPYYVYYYVDGDFALVVAVWSSMRRRGPSLIFAP